ncbi:MAG TPA: 16S rRNA (guanine(966)-N(2))-methyltransferase RsmD [Elusimicrobiota bacterium]|nr:16S rRNA (guanine(966)-N(2))-methyltransferase RsmD [Elusimicrobiota bacterium]
MRIIAGAVRGRHLSAPNYPGLRPISARIKKSLFDILKGVLPGCKLLDLFAGSGAVGLEALSRGADFVFFVEKNKSCRDAITVNLEKSGLAARAKVWPGNALEDLSWIPFRAEVSSFDVIFLGPPYKDEEKKPLAYSSPALAQVARAGLLSPLGIVVCQHHIKEEVFVPEEFALVRREKYGDTLLDFLRPKRASTGVVAP